MSFVPTDGMIPRSYQYHIVAGAEVKSAKRMRNDLLQAASRLTVEQVANLGELAKAVFREIIDGNLRREGSRAAEGTTSLMATGAINDDGDRGHQRGRSSRFVVDKLMVVPDEDEEKQVVESWGRSFVEEGPSSDAQEDGCSSASMSCSSTSTSSTTASTTVAGGGASSLDEEALQVPRGQKTVSAAQKPASAAQKTVSAAPKTVSAAQKTVSAAQKTVSAAQKTVSAATDASAIKDASSKDASAKDASATTPTSTNQSDGPNYPSNGPGENPTGQEKTWTQMSPTEKAAAAATAEFEVFRSLLSLGVKHNIQDNGVIVHLPAAVRPLRIHN